MRDSMRESASEIRKQLVDATAPVEHFEAALHYFGLQIEHRNDYPAVVAIWALSASLVRTCFGQSRMEEELPHYVAYTLTTGWFLCGAAVIGVYLAFGYAGRRRRGLAGSMVLHAVFMTLIWSSGGGLPKVDFGCPALSTFLEGFGGLDTELSPFGVAPRSVFLLLIPAWLTMRWLERDRLEVVVLALLVLIHSGQGALLVCVSASLDAICRHDRLRSPLRLVVVVGSVWVMVSHWLPLLGTAGEAYFVGGAIALVLLLLQVRSVWRRRVGRLSHSWERNRRNDLLLSVAVTGLGLGIACILPRSLSADLAAQRWGAILLQVLLFGCVTSAADRLPVTRARRRKRPRWVLVAAAVAVLGGGVAVAYKSGVAWRRCTSRIAGDVAAADRVSVDGVDFSVDNQLHIIWYVLGKAVLTRNPRADTVLFGRFKNG
ncbi:MAG: hypothetical protein AAF628_16000 [Planctomycetota bacterium]